LIWVDHQSLRHARPTNFKISSNLNYNPFFSGNTVQVDLQTNQSRSIKPQETSEDIPHWLRQGEAEKLRIELLGPVAFEIKSFWVNLGEVMAKPIETI
jgi:hypothetical protein